MTENDYRLINLRYSCPLLRQEDLLAGKVPTAPTISSMIAGMQVQEALKLIHGMPVEAGTAMVYNGVSNQFYKTAYQRRDDCLSHETYPEAVELPLGIDHTAADLFDAVTHHVGDDQLHVALDRDLVLAIDCGSCGTSQHIMKPLQLVGADKAVCPECQGTAKPKLEHRIEAGTDVANAKLRDLGIAPYDIVRVRSAEQEAVFLLAGKDD